MAETASERLAELYDLREALEAHAIAASAARLDPRDRLGMERSAAELARVLELASRQGWTREYADRWLAADAEFHLSILRQSKHAAARRGLECDSRHFWLAKRICGKHRSRSHSAGT